MTENTPQEDTMGYDHQAAREFRAGFHGVSESLADTELMLTPRGELVPAPRFEYCEVTLRGSSAEAPDLDLLEFNRRAHDRRADRQERARLAERRAHRRELALAALLAFLLVLLIVSVARAFVATPTASAAVPASWPWAQSLPMATDVREAPEFAPVIARDVEWWAARGVTGCPGGVRAFVANDLGPSVGGRGADCAVAFDDGLFTSPAIGRGLRCLVQLHEVGHALGLDTGPGDNHEHLTPLMAQAPTAVSFCYPSRPARVTGSRSRGLKRWVRRHERGRVVGSSAGIGDAVARDLAAEALAAARVAARDGEAVNPGLRFTVASCVRLSVWRFDCPVDASDQAGAPAGRAVYHVGRELTRRRRGGRWVGDWRPTGRLVVTGVDTEPTRVP